MILADADDESKIDFIFDNVLRIIPIVFVPYAFIEIVLCNVFYSIQYPFLNNDVFQFRENDVSGNQNFLVFIVKHQRHPVNDVQI